MTIKAMSTAAQNDVKLVSESLSGNRDAFGQIISRYQSLVCSLAYSATGSLGFSEDIAQETFLTAWRELAKLSDATKLRAWLCGIARNLVNNSLRRRQHEPIHSAESLDTIHESPSPEPSPSAQAISREEEAILWRALERIPDTYREPMILFYREDQSVENVAQELELSEDAVKQRLSRGRKLLTEEVAAFVEGTLKRTTPGKAFTLGVLAALPVMTTSTKAAAIGATAAKGAMAAKSAVTLGSAGGLFWMLGGYFGIRANIENTKSPRERQFVVRRTWIGIGFVILALALMLGVRNLMPETRVWLGRDPFVRDVVFAALMFCLAVYSVVMFEYRNRRQRQIQIEDGTLVESEWTTPENPGGFSLDLLRSGSKATVYAAAALVMVVAGVIVVAIWEALAGHWIFALLLLGVLFWRWRQRSWGRQPRFDARLSTLVGGVRGCGLFTLIVCNLTRFRGQMAAIDLRTIGFNVVVVLAYAALIGFLAWRHKHQRSIAIVASP